MPALRLTTPPSSPSDSCPLSARELYALAIFSWTRAHPHATKIEFLAMIARVERQVRKS
jgi:hypothetical protein